MKLLFAFALIFLSTSLIGQEKLTLEEKQDFILANPSFSTTDSLLFRELFSDFEKHSFHLLSEKAKSASSTFEHKDLVINFTGQGRIDYRNSSYIILSSKYDLYFGDIDQNYYASFVFKVDGRVRSLDFRTIDGKTFYVTIYEKKKSSKKRWKLRGWQIMELMEE